MDTPRVVTAGAAVLSASSDAGTPYTGGSFSDYPTIGQILWEREVYERYRPVRERAKRMVRLHRAARAIAARRVPMSGLCTTRHRGTTRQSSFRRVRSSTSGTSRGDPDLGDEPPRPPAAVAS